MVFAPRVVEAIARGKSSCDPTGAMRDVIASSDGLSCETGPGPSGDGDPVKLRVELQRAMTLGAGVLRDAESLANTAAAIGEVAGAMPDDAIELSNLATVAGALVRSATAREESRGAHTRTDFPESRAEFRRRLVINA
jgi:L-aspartate oxidase